MARKSAVKRVERPGSRWRAIRARSRANDEAFWGEPVLLGRGLSKRGAMRALVAGPVALAGKVVECETGYRAEKARPLAFVLPSFSEWRLAAALNREFNVSIYNDPAVAIRDFPGTRPSPPEQAALAPYYLRPEMRWL